MEFKKTGAVRVPCACVILMLVSLAGTARSEMMTYSADFLLVTYPIGVYEVGSGTTVTVDAKKSFGWDYYDPALGAYEKVTGRLITTAEVEHGRFHFTVDMETQGTARYYELYPFSGDHISYSLQLKSHDQIKLVWRGPGIAPSLPTDLYAAMNFDGTLTSTGKYFGDSHIGDMVFSVGATTKILKMGVDTPFGTLSPTLGYELAIDTANQTVNVTKSLTVGFSLSEGGVSLSMPHTISAVGYVFADGTTPESHGWELQFASGITSPNITTANVPEPATLTIWSLGALGSAIAGYRRRRAA